MKKLLLCAIVVSVMAGESRAQLFSPESFTGAAIGAIAGGVIGHNNGRHGGEGAAIGAGIGLLAGSLVRDSRERHGYYSSGHYSSPGRGYVSIGVSSGYHRHYHHRHSHYRNSYWRPGIGFGYSYHRPIYAGPTYVAPIVRTPVYIQQPAPVVIQPQPAPAPAPQQITIINNYYGSSSPMSSANTMFGR